MSNALALTRAAAHYLEQAANVDTVCIDGPQAKANYINSAISCLTRAIELIEKELG